MTTIGVTGHQHIPHEAMPHVESGIQGVLRWNRDELVGVCSLAAGTDQLFAQAVIEVGGTLHVVVPCERYDETFGPADLPVYYRLLTAAQRIETLEHPEPTEAAFLEAGHRVADLCDLLVAVWDGQPARGLGGTADVVHYARAAGREVVVVWPPGLTR